MERRTVVRALRAIRRRKGLTQAQLGRRIGISRSELGRWEASNLDRCSVEETERWATSLNARLLIDLRVDGERPLVDARHAQMQNWLVALLRGAGWIVEAEASFNVYGDRGRIDVLAFHPTAQAMVVAEIKSRVDDAQELLGRLDVKRRVAPTIARDRGWHARAVVPVIVVQEGTTAKRRIAMHAALFDAFPLRARAAMAWLRRPTQAAPAGILALVRPPSSAPS